MTLKHIFSWQVRTKNTHFQYCSTGDSVTFSERPCFKKASDWLNVMLPSGLKHLLLAQVPSEKTTKIAIFVQKGLIVDYPSGIIDIKFTFFLPTYTQSYHIQVHKLTKKDLPWTPINFSTFPLKGSLTNPQMTSPLFRTF